MAQRQMKCFPRATRGGREEGHEKRAGDHSQQQAENREYHQRKRKNIANSRQTIIHKAWSDAKESKLSDSARTIRRDNRKTCTRASQRETRRRRFALGRRSRGDDVVSLWCPRTRRQVCLDKQAGTFPLIPLTGQSAMRGTSRGGAQ